MDLKTTQQEAEYEIASLLKDYAYRFGINKMIIEVTKLNFANFNKETNRMEITNVDYNVCFHK